MEDRTCKQCSGVLPTDYPNRVYCSSRCRGAASYSNRPRHSCASCGDPMKTVKRPGDDPSSVLCRGCKRAAAADQSAAQCEFCEASFRRVKRSAGAWTRFCSKSCARKAQLVDGSHSWMKSPNWSPALTDDERKARRFRQGERARRKRRARLAEVESEPYTLAEIAERDGHRCGICGRRVNMSLKHPHPRSASVDHIIPLSHPGATDTKANVRLAHLGENLARGNRAGWEQQLLIG